MVPLATLVLLCVITWLDVFTFSGYLAQNLLSQKILALCVITLSAFYVLYPSKKVLTEKPGSLLLTVTTILYLGSLTLDGVFGQGTTFSLLRLRPESMFFASLPTLTLCLVLLIPRHLNPKKRLLRFLLGFSLIFYILRLLPITTTQAAVNLRKIITNPTATYDQKMGLEWGVFYEEMLFVLDHTSPTATIILPTDLARYPLHANVDLVRYFLYPRDLVVSQKQASSQDIYILDPEHTPPLRPNDNEELMP